MVQSYKFVLYYLWIAPHVFLALVPAFMFRRDLHKKFPLFFVYTLFETLEFLLLFGAHLIDPGRAASYRYLFVATLAGSTALRFGIIQEIFNNVFREYPRLEAFAGAAMKAVTGLLLLAAVSTAVYSSGNASGGLLVGVSLLDRSVAIIQAGLLLFLFLFSRLFGLSWRSYTFGIALGFAIYASTDLAVWAMRLTGPKESLLRLLDLLPTGSYHVSVVVWLGYLLATEKAVDVAAYPVPDIDRWSGELERPR